MTEVKDRILKEKLIVRLPDGMRSTLKAVAEANGRSLNAEVTAALDAWLHQSPKSDITESHIHSAEAAAVMAAEIRNALNRYEGRIESSRKSSLEAIFRHLTKDLEN